MNTGTINSQKLDLLYKKFMQTAYTNIDITSSFEAEGSSTPNIIANNIWTLEVPSSKPFNITDLNVKSEVLSTIDSNNVNIITGKRYYVDDKSYKYYYICYYEKVLLNSDYVNKGYSWRYYGTNPISGSTVVNTNILRGAIAGNYDPNGSYKISVYNNTTGAEIAQNDINYPWTFDCHSGYLTFFTKIVKFYFYMKNIYKNHFYLS